MKNPTNSMLADGLLCMLVLSTLALACRSTRHAAPADTAPFPVAEVGELRGDRVLEAMLEVLDPRMRVSSTGRILTFDLRNKSARAEKILYAIEWFDRGGQRVAASSRYWEALVIEPDASIEVEVTVPVPEAESWRWHAVYPDPVQ